MSESRKNHFDVDGAQEKEEEHAASYKPIPESDTEFRPPSKASLTKSKEKVSADGAEEKLLSKEDEAKITTRVDMAEAKYVVGDHRNGDAKIELDANKRQFSGLTKEELLKYAEDPFWVRLRWFMFVLFWALWVCMLAGAIAIIIQAPKCYPPTPKTWYEVGPLADRSSVDVADYSSLDWELDRLAKAKVQGIFINPCANTYDVLDSTICIDDFKKFLVKAKDKGIKLIVDLIANYVPKTHKWFIESENKTEEYKDFFIWGVGKDAIPDGSRPDVPNNWISIHGSPAWSWSEKRKQYYLHQYYEHQADLNFHNKVVQMKFEEVIKKWLEAGAAGVRLHKARQLVVNMTLPDEAIDRSASVTQNEYSFLRHTATSDQPKLDELIAQWSGLVASVDKEHVFTVYEDGRLKPEWYVLRNSSAVLRPPSAAPLTVGPHPTELVSLAATLNKLADNWTALQLTSEEREVSSQLLLVSMALPLTPVLAPNQLPLDDNSTASVYSFAHLSDLREEASVKFGERRVVALPSQDNTTQFLAVARWKAGHTGFVCVLNAGGAAAGADLAALESLPAALTVHHLDALTSYSSEYKKNDEVQANNVTIPAKSAIVFSYVPKLAAEK